VNKEKAFVISLSLQILAGLTSAFLSSLLIYFKQKELLHIVVVLFSVLAIYFLTYLLRKKHIYFSTFSRTISLIFILLICWLGPQLIYQIRPYTFYISGFAIGGIVLFALSANILRSSKSLSFPWDFGTFLIAFTTGYFIPWVLLQCLIFGLSLIVILLFLFSSQFNRSFKVVTVFSLFAVGITFWWFSKPLIFHEEQINYEDKILFSANTQYHQVVITQWQKDHWIFMDKLKNVSSIDDYLFYEPMAHSVFRIEENLNNVLIIGGENGCLLREVLKHEDVHSIDVISYDTLLRNLGEELSYFTRMNLDSYRHEKIQILHENLIEFVSNTNRKYTAIFIDLPDPRSIETNQYYTLEFYERIKIILAENGVVITQAGSPYFATQAYFSIGETIKKAGFNILPLHNQILTLGEWGWYVCSTKLGKTLMKKRLLERENSDIETKWFNEEAAKLVSSFGKTHNDTLNVGINTLENPLVYQYYLKGNWELK